MAITMNLDDKVEKTGKTICPIMSPRMIQWNGDYAVCVKELCALWDDGHCAFCKRAESEE